MKRFKTEQTDDTIGMSPFAISCPNADFDGDSLYLASIKEMCTVIDLMKIHPMSTLLGGVGEALSNTVHMSDEMTVALHCYITDNGELDIESYFKQVQDLKKKKKLSNVS